MSTVGVSELFGEYENDFHQLVAEAFPSRNSFQSGENDERAQLNTTQHTYTYVIIYNYVLCVKYHCVECRIWKSSLRSEKKKGFL